MKKYSFVMVLMVWSAMMAFAQQQQGLAPAKSSDSASSAAVDQTASGEQNTPPAQVAQPGSLARETAPATSASSGGSVNIGRAEVCAGITDREPVGSGDHFQKEIGKVYCFCEITGMPVPATIVHKWYFKYQLVSSIALRVKAERWRTFSYKTVAPDQAGDWKVEIVNAQNDEVLKMVTFKVD